MIYSRCNFKLHSLLDRRNLTHCANCFVISNMSDIYINNNSWMVRFKNRYILADYSQMSEAAQTNDRFFLKLLKQVCEEMLGELFLAKITFSLQIKYMHLGKVLIRVPRDHCTNLIACIFMIKGLKIVKVSGTIRGIQLKLYELARKELKRELSKG